MKKNISKFLSIIMCLVLVCSISACSKAKNDDKAAVDFGYADMEFKYSLNCSEWFEVQKGNEMFRADGTYKAGDTEVVYLHIKNHSEVNSYYRIILSFAAEGGAEFGFVGDVRTAFESVEAAKTAVGDGFKAVKTNYIYTRTMGAESTTTMALVINLPEGASGGKLDFNIRFEGGLVASDGKANSSKIENGIAKTNAHTYAIIEDATVDTVVTNDDSSVKVVIPKNTFKQGDFLPITVEATTSGDKYMNFVAEFDIERKFKSAIEMTVLVGYGLDGVEVTWGGDKIESSYDKFTGSVTFKVVPQSSSFKVQYTGSVDMTGVVVQGSNKQFANFNEAINHAVNNPQGEILTFVIFGKADYTVDLGEKVSFVGQNTNIKKVNVIGGNDTAEIHITQESNGVPSLPYAGKDVSINYSNLTFQSDNEHQEGGEYARHIDYRGEADIAFRNCHFKKALAARGPNSSVVVENCDFKCPTVQDTLKGYCFYSIQKIGGGEITVQLTGNDFTGCWGGINLDWGEGDFVVTDNKFGGYNCSKPAIQLSHANTMLIENNRFENIIDENAFRFYNGYNSQKTSIINNTFEKVAYILQTDVPGAINTFKELKFEGNTLSKDVDLTLGHKANAPADAVSPHGYVIDTTLNTIK